MSVKHEYISDELKELIIDMNPGDTMLSVRQIMRRFSVSQATVISALTPLLNEGILEKRQSVGMFVTEEVMKYKPSASPVILFAIPRWPSVDYWQVENIFLELQEEYDFIAKVVHFDWQDKVIQSLPAGKADGLIVLSTGGPSTPQQIKHLDSFHVPYVVLGQSLSDIDVNTVYCDDEYEGTVAADFLIKRGHKKLAVIISDPHGPTIRARVRGFVRYSELQGAEVSIIDCGIKYGENSLTKVYEATKKLLESDQNDFTAVLVVSIEPCLSVLKAYYESDLVVPDDISIISIGDSFNCNFFSPALTTVTTKKSTQITECINLLKGIIDGSESFPVKKCIQPQIIERESTSHFKNKVTI